MRIIMDLTEMVITAITIGCLGIIAAIMARWVCGGV